MALALLGASLLCAIGVKALAANLTDALALVVVVTCSGELGRIGIGGDGCSLIVADSALLVLLAGEHTDLLLVDDPYEIMLFDILLVSALTGMPVIVVINGSPCVAEATCFVCRKNDGLGCCAAKLCLGCVSRNVALNLKEALKIYCAVSISFPTVELKGNEHIRGDLNTVGIGSVAALCVPVVGRCVDIIAYNLLAGALKVLCNTEILGSEGYCSVGYEGGILYIVGVECIVCAAVIEAYAILYDNIGAGVGSLGSITFIIRYSIRRSENGYDAPVFRASSCSLLIGLNDLLFNSGSSDFL